MANEVALAMVILTSEETIIEAVDAYDYPPVTYDFRKDREHRFENIRGLESYLRDLLRSLDEQRVRRAVLYWGFYRVGYKGQRVKQFREKATNQQLRSAIEVFQTLEGADLRRLKNLELPPFANMAFVTKLRMFLEPERYCVLDSKVASLNLANQEEIDAYLVEGQRAAESQYQRSKQTTAELIAKLQRARNASQIPG